VENRLTFPGQIGSIGVVLSVRRAFTAHTHGLPFAGVARAALTSPRGPPRALRLVAELLIPDTLELVQLVTDGCRQSRVTPLPAPLAGESIEIQYYEPGATIEVLVAEPRRRLSIESGTLVEVGVDEITSRSAVNVEVAPHRRRTVRIGIREAWTVDSVEDLQTKRPVEWDVDEPPGEPAELEIALGQPGQVVVRGGSVYLGRTPAGRISGSVLREKTDEAVRLCAFASGEDGREFGALVNPDGSFEIRNVPPGTYRVGAYPTGAGGTEVCIEGVRVESDGSCADLRLAAIDLRGKFHDYDIHVVDASGAGIPGPVLELEVRRGGYEPRQVRLFPGAHTIVLQRAEWWPW